MNNPHNNPLSELSWSTVIAANDAHTEIIKAQSNQAALHELAEFSLDIVPITAAAHEEAQNRVGAAATQFAKILDVAAVLDIKSNNPNADAESKQPSKPDVSSEENQDLLRKVIAGKIIPTMETDSGVKPVIDIKAFKGIAALIMGDSIKSVTGRSYNSAVRNYGQDPHTSKFFAKRTPEHSIEFVAGIELDHMANLNREVQEHFMHIPHMGEATAEVFGVVSDFVELNAEALKAQF